MTPKIEAFLTFGVPVLLCLMRDSCFGRCLWQICKVLHFPSDISYSVLGVHFCSPFIPHWRSFLHSVADLDMATNVTSIPYSNVFFIYFWDLH